MIAARSQTHTTLPHICGIHGTSLKEKRGDDSWSSPVFLTSFYTSITNNKTFSIPFLLFLRHYYYCNTVICFIPKILLSVFLSFLNMSRFSWFNDCLSGVYCIFWGTKWVVRSVTCLAMSAFVAACLSRRTAGSLPSPSFPLLLGLPPPLKTGKAWSEIKRRGGQNLCQRNISRRSKYLNV